MEAITTSARMDRLRIGSTIANSIPANPIFRERLLGDVQFILDARARLDPENNKSKGI
jgi:hypothetical protein